jgi:DNA-binding LacI/PurR family transcriptional regulator
MAQPSSLPADIRAVAHRARVSIATVSRVVNQVSTVDPKLAERVKRAVQELRYTPNTQARGLVSGRSRMIGLIVSQITNPFFPELIQSFEDKAVRCGYEILIGSTNYSTERMTQCVRRMVERKVEGVAVMTFGMDEDLLRELSRLRIPVVSVGAAQNLDRVTSLAVDYGQGIDEAVQHLAALGHRKICFIAGPLKVRSAKLREMAFIAAMERIGVKCSDDSILEGDHTMEGGLAAAERMFQRKQIPTAVLCSNDMTAIGVLHAVSDRGMQVPKDISIIGFDDIHMAQFTVPPLTSIRMSGSDLSTAALDSLLATLAGSSADSAKRQIRIPTRLVVRQTSGYPRGTSNTAGLAATARKVPVKRVKRDA